MANGNNEETPLEQRARQRQESRDARRAEARGQGIKQAEADKGSNLDYFDKPPGGSIEETMRLTEPSALRVPDPSKAIFAGSVGPELGKGGLGNYQPEIGGGENNREGAPSYESGSAVLPLSVVLAYEGDEGVANTREILVIAGVVSGVTAVSKVPVIGVDPLTDDPPPTMVVDDGARWIGIEFEVIPESEPDGSGGYVLAEGGTLTGDFEITEYASETAMDTATQDPSINTSTGAVVDNGIFVIPLALVQADNTIDQAGYFGPIGVKLCATGILQIFGPVMVINS